MYLKTVKLSSRWCKFRGKSICPISYQFEIYFRANASHFEIKSKHILTSSDKTFQIL